MAYGQVPAVNKKNVCCFRGVYIEGLNIANPQEDPTYWPGMGCSGELRDEIYDSVKERVMERGQAGQLRKLEAILDQTFDLAVMIPLLANANGVPCPPPQETMDALYKDRATSILPPKSVLKPPKRTFELIEFDVTNYCECINMCCLKKKLILDPDDYQME